MQVKAIGLNRIKFDLKWNLNFPLMAFDLNHYLSVYHPHVAAMWMLSVTFVCLCQPEHLCTQLWSEVGQLKDRRETNDSDEVATATHSPHHRFLFGA